MTRRSETNREVTTERLRAGGADLACTSCIDYQPHYPERTAQRDLPVHGQLLLVTGLDWTGLRKSLDDFHSAVELRVDELPRVHAGSVTRARTLSQKMKGKPEMAGRTG